MLKKFLQFLFILSIISLFSMEVYAQEYILRSSKGEDSFTTYNIGDTLYCNVITIAGFLEWECEYNWPLKRFSFTTSDGDSGAVIAGYDGYLWNNELIRIIGLSPILMEETLYVPLKVLNDVWGPRAGFVIEPARSSPIVPTYEPDTIVIDLVPTPVPEVPDETSMGFGEKLLPGDKLRRWIILDPGHGGGDKGFVNEDLVESQITYSICEKLKEYLESRYGYYVSMTRPDNLKGVLSNVERTAKINTLPGDFVLSIHLGGGGVSAPNGWTVFYYSDVLDVTSPELIKPEMDEEFRFQFRESFLKPWENAYKYSIRESISFANQISDAFEQVLDQQGNGIRPARLELLQGTPKPGLLVEIGTLSNPDEARKFRTDKYKNRVVSALAYGIENYIRIREGKGIIPPPKQ